MIKWIPKVWGGETIFASNDLYCGKILEVKKNHFSSFHRHKKVEDWLVRGKILLLSSYQPVLGKSTSDKCLIMPYSNEAYVCLPKVEDSGVVGELKKTVLEDGDTIHIPSLQWHLFYALEDSKIFEVSTPDEESERLTESY